MEVKVIKGNLEMAVAEVNRVAPKRATLPIVHNVLLRTNEGRLTVTATDLEVTVTAYVGAQVAAEGASTVPAVKLSQMLRRIKADQAMTVKAEGKRTTFSMDGRTFSLEGVAAKDYPPTPSKFDKRGKVEGGELKDRLKRVVICAAVDDTRLVLHTVNMKAEGDTLTLTAADGFTLGTFSMPYKGQEFEANVPLSVVRVLLRLLEDDEVGVDVSEHTIRFALRNYDVTGTLVSGSYPHLTNIIPVGYDHAVTVDREALRSEVETAQVLAQDGAGIIRFLADGAGLRVVAKSEEVGDYEATIPAAWLDGEDGKVALNGRHVLDILDRMVAGPVSMDWRPERPVRLEQGTDGFYLTMPMTVTW